MSETDNSTASAQDPDVVARQIRDIAEQSQKAAMAFWQGQVIERQAHPFEIVDTDAVGRAFFDWGVEMMRDPQGLAEAQMALWKQQTELWQSTWRAAWGGEKPTSVSAERGDRRFKDAAWNDELLYDYLKQSYLLSANWLRSLTQKTSGLDEKAQERIDFYTRQFVSAASPSNLVLTNPAVLKKVRETGGQNLVEGFKHLLEDLEKGKGRLRVTMTDEEAFEVGGNIAATPGKVVYENELMQLIQYSPTTDEVHVRPLLIVPPWINKYYILDLQQKNSFVKHVVDQGHTVFMISWRNPDESLAEKTFEDYLTDGPLSAFDAIEQATGETDVSIVGFCIGGILVSTLLGYLTAKGRAGRIKSATFLTSLFDFDEVGEVSIFIDPEQIARIERHVEEKGYLEGRHMANMFSMMRENDLVWSFVVNNYLLGREPPAFDLLYWNSDSTGLPATMLVYYLKEIYQKNKLREPGGLVLFDTPIDLSAVKTSVYIMSAKDDHIAPWESCYPGTQLFSGSRRFILTASGHIAGVINPPGSGKYGYWTNRALPDSPGEWLEGGEWQDGSWWSDWHAWLGRRGGKKVPAREPGDGALEPIEDAPGRYVKVRAN